MGQIADTFTPSEKMIGFLQALLDPEVPAFIKSCCEHAGVSRTTFYRDWATNPQFCQWLKEEYQKGCGYLMPVLDKIAWEMCRKDYRYFEHLQRKYGGTPGQTDNRLKGLHEILEGRWRPKLPDDLSPNVRQSIIGEGTDTNLSEQSVK